MPETRFVVVCHARTGSNWLCGLLNSHPSVLCHHEVFHPNGIYYAHGYRDGQLAHLGAVAERDADPAAFLERLFAADFGHQAVGVKLMRGHAPALLRDLLRDPAIRKIVLHRANRVRAFVSRSRALATGLFAHGNYDGVAVTVDPGELIAFAARYNEFYRSVDESLRGQDVCRLSYERLAEPDYLAPALDFLDVEPDELLGTHERQSSGPLRHAIANFDEVAAALVGSDLLAELLADRAAPALT